jgi:hypothetical protein
VAEPQDMIEQGVGYNHTGAILWWMKNGAAIRAGGDELIDRQYAGAKAALRPVYERVLRAAYDARG